MEENTCFEFPVTIYSVLEQITPTLSKARARIFYKYENRNGSYISDEFAEKLISTLPYAPIKGIYDSANEDYTDHGPSNEYGRIYGVVPKDMNFAWESHVDDDGVERIYATTDVLLYTAMYKEANDIFGKGQSMELYPPSIKGEWAIVNGHKLFKFTDGCFFGLQVLGDKAEPCFEGASFFTLETSENAEELVNKMFQILDELNRYVSKHSNGGKSNMKINFKVSDNQKFEAIWNLLNTNYNEESNWEVTYAILDIWDDYALVFNYEDNCYERVTYTKDDENNMVTIGEKTVCYIIDVTEREKSALEALRATNGGTYEQVDEKFDSGVKAIEEVKEYSTKITELENSLSTLNTDKENVQGEYTNALNTISELTAEMNELKEYKAQNEKQRKLKVVESYSELLSNELIEEFEAKVDEYADAAELDKDLAYALKNSNLSVFSNAPVVIPVVETTSGTVAEILNKYKK